MNTSTFATFCSYNLSLYQDCENYIAEEESGKWKYIFQVRQVHFLTLANFHLSVHINLDGCKTREKLGDSNM